MGAIVHHSEDNVISENETITRLNCALDRCTILWLYVPGFQRQLLLFA